MQRGFTLVELLVVLALIATAAAITPLAFGRLNESAQYRDAVRGVLGGLREARHRALTEGREVRFTVDLAGRRYGVEGSTARTFHEALDVRTTVASIEMGADRTASIRFLPSGGATGGTVEIVRPSGDGTRLKVDWLSGAVLQSALAP